ncbi:MlaD family protein [Flavobacterium aquicola]|uniref:Phospholipid/cholesterol/gamma-HCH transport system substrate-binding protein n=1 Tax=Flavobacterium aquicola TaxID=1682742 RepID=A0A3E0EQL0_9FLAO|nr:MlaD family protein [Flavobacterium aquicola]REH00503.1 phospholipid/cholesterol/gamma-HCH transport system substrate-binding protein [Flavobacterium aquicola]
MNKEAESNWKLGMFVTIGLILFILIIYFVGKQQNLFGDNFQLKSKFKTVSGLKIGNNVRFSGINVGTVSEIELVNDSSVVVVLTIQKNVQKYIKTDARASIGSDGLVGDKILAISPGSSSNKIIKDNAFIQSTSPIEMDDLMKSVKSSVDNAEIITGQLAQFTYNMNNGKGTLSKLMNDKDFAKKLDATMSNLQSGTKGLSENMEAAKHNFLLKGYFNKKEKQAAKKKEELKKQELKKKEEAEKKADSINKK